MPRAHVATRVVLVIVALLVIAVSGLWWFQSYRSEQAQDVFGDELERPTPEKVALVEELLDDTLLLNPHTDSDFQRGVALLGVGETERGTRILLDLVEREPTNAQVWAVLTSAARQSGDRELDRRAREAVARLNPYEQRDD